MHRLGELTNGYPRNPIAANIWHEGCMLTLACDQFADASRNHPTGEEQVSRLAATMALQDMGHYPHEVFPRVLRNARCCETLGQIDKALDGYRCVTSDFETMALQTLFEQPELEEVDWVTLRSMAVALAGVARLSPDGLSATQQALQVQLAEVLSRSG